MCKGIARICWVDWTTNEAHALGLKNPFHAEEWVVYVSPGLGATALGKGTTEDAAWSSAAEVVLARSKKAIPSFKEWLALEAERERVSTRKLSLIEDWTTSVVALLAQLVRWLAEDDETRVLQVESGKIQLDEQGLGSYEIATLRIYLFARFADLIPAGRNVVGGVGKHGELGYKSEGRVDLTNGVDKFLLYRVVTPDGKEWVLVDDEDYSVKPLTKASFEYALQVLLS